MGKTLGVVIAVLVVIGGVSAAFFLAVPQQEEAKVQGASIQFKTTEHNFGKIIQGEKVTTEFEFANTGDQDLVISKVRSTCGCTAALASADTIKPGEKGSIKVTFNSNGRRGKNTKKIKVHSNAVNLTKAELTIISDILVELDFKPPRAYMGEFEAGGSLTSEVELTNRTDQTIKISKFENNRDEVKVEVDKMELGPQEVAKVKVTMEIPKDYDRNHLSDKITFHTDRKGSEVVYLPVYSRNKNFKSRPNMKGRGNRPGMKGGKGALRANPRRNRTGQMMKGKVPSKAQEKGKSDKEQTQKVQEQK